MPESIIEIDGQTILHVKKLTIEGVNPDRLQYTVREFFDPEGVIYEAEHVPTRTVVRGWATNGVGQVVERCKQEVEESTNARR